MLKRPSALLAGLPLGQKFLFSLIAFIIIPLVLAFLLVNSNAAREIQGKSDEALLQSFKQGQYHLASLHSDAEEVSLSLLANPSMQSLIKSYRAGKIKQYEVHDYNLKNFIEPLLSRSIVQSICVSIEDKVLYKGGKFLVNREDTAYHAQAAKLDGKCLWVPAEELPNLIAGIRNQPMISVIRAVRDLDSDRQIATIRVSMTEEGVCALYQSDIYHGMTAILTDAQGRVFSAMDKSFLGKNISGDDQFREALTQSDGVYGASMPDGAPAKLFHYAVDGTDWRVMLMVPLSSMSSETRMINQVLMFAIGICMLFGALFYTILNRSVIRPVKTLRDEMVKLSAGNFHAHVQLDARKGDEIDTLKLTFVEMAQRLDTLIHTVYQAEIQERDARLIALESQINPHFLYNTLDSIRWLALRNHDTAVAEQIDAFSDVFRHVINQGEELTTIEEELHHLESYVFLQKTRFGDRLSVHIDVEDGLLPHATPKLILQPLIENAIHHGLEQKLGAGEVWVNIYRSPPDALVFEVKDNGVGADEEAIRASLGGQESTPNVFALKNIDDRVKLRYGAEFGLDFASTLGVGTTVKVRIPEGKIHETDDRG